MSLPFYIARRYIKSKKNSQLISLISVITIAGIALGVAVLIIALTVLEGFEKVVEDKIIGFNEHIVISGFSNKNLPASREYTKHIEDLASPYVENITPYISKSVILRSNKNADGLILIGIEDNAELDIKDYIISGSYNFEKEGKDAIIIGKKLADRLGIDVEDKLTIIALRDDKIPSPFNPPLLKQFIVSGVYESGMAIYDDARVFIKLATASEFLSMENEISGYNIRMNDISKIDSIEQVLQRNLSYPYYVQSIFKKHQNIFTWLDLQNKPIPIILGMVIIVAAFNMIGTILMIVLERTSEIGMLRSIGARKKEIIKLFLFQGSYLSLIGVLIGNLIAISLTMLQINFDLITLPGSVYFLTAVPFSLNPFTYLIVSLIALLICFLTTLIPSYIASKANIINAIRFS